MPELPEVETIARNLRQTLIGKRIVQVRVSGMSLRRPVSPHFAARLRNLTVAGVYRRGKYLVLSTRPHGYCLVHLGMSGRIFYNPPQGCSTGPHTHAVIRFEDDSELHYRDHRRFGLLEVYRCARLSDIPELKALGRDPLGRNFRPAWLHGLLCQSRQEIKSFLLDQRRIAGIGNIYACEALFGARLHPARRCDTLSLDETERLVRSTRRVLHSAIRHRGTSFSDFIDANGQAGGHQQYLAVYQRQGKRCVRCGSTIERVVQGNRSSFFCPQCQALVMSGTGI
jgi:formamidopyrimidine-DNA glycosylase